MPYEQFADCLTQSAAISPNIIMELSTGLDIRSTTCDHNKYLIRITPQAMQENAVISMKIPLASGTSFFRLGQRRTEILPPNWSGNEENVSAADGAAIGCLLDSADRCVFAYACSAIQDMRVQYGAIAGTPIFVVIVEIAKMSQPIELLLIDSKEPLDQCMRFLSRWMIGGRDPYPIPEIARNPIFSTWYAFLQDVNEVELSPQLERIKSIGCSCIFLDDGWQDKGDGTEYGLGRWQPNLQHFPNLRSTIAHYSSQGISTVLWIAPLLIGKHSDAYAKFNHYDLISGEGFLSHTFILDPRRATIREYITNLLSATIQSYGAAGLKVDFIEQARAYQGKPLPNPEDNDIDDVSGAVMALFKQISESFQTNGIKTPLIECRQPYTTPLLAPYSNVVRVHDCPADAISNRVRIIDERLTAAGRVVHSDMLMWDTETSIQACAEQIMSVFFSVPQISVRPDLLNGAQTKVCSHLLSLWKANRDTILSEEFHPHAQELNYPLVTSYRGDKQITGLYMTGIIVDIDLERTSEIVVLNSTYSHKIYVRVHPRNTPSRLFAKAYQPDGTLDSYIPRNVSCRKEEDCRILDFSVPPFGTLKITTTKFRDK